MTVPYQYHHSKIKEKKLSFSSSKLDNLDIFLGKPFWIWDREKHRLEFLIENGNCCMNHILGLPQKNNREYPIFDY
jgi:hypothetical protein